MKCSAILGAAGTGKTTKLRQLLDADPNFATLTATTGIAAVNLGEGVTTVNSALGFFDEFSLQKALNSGSLTRRFERLSGTGVKNLVIDECSMLNAAMLDMIYQGAMRVSSTVRPVNLILTGDYVQLPPVQGEYAFKAKCWPEFEKNCEVLREVKRQTDLGFLEILTLLRGGRGADVAKLLYRSGVPFVGEPDIDFDGTTLFSVGASVDKFNRERLCRLQAPTIKLQSKRWGKQRGEWANIPPFTEVKHGAVVMILANNPPDFTYVNGDLAHVVDDFGSTVERDNAWWCDLKLMRSGMEFTLGTVVRDCRVSERPDNAMTCDVPMKSDFRNKDEFYEAIGRYFSEVSMKGAPFFDPITDEWVVGQIEYVPLRLGYASTIHKAQGLTLDRVQVDCRHKWAEMPSMMYVAISRCRTLQGLQIVGDVGKLSRRINTSREVTKWI